MHETPDTRSVDSSLIGHRAEPGRRGVRIIFAVGLSASALAAVRAVMFYAVNPQG
jgi:hypothetical protein